MSTSDTRRLIDAVVPAALNPIAHTGTIATATLVVTVLTSPFSGDSGFLQAVNAYALDATFLSGAVHALRLGGVLRTRPGLRRRVSAPMIATVLFSLAAIALLHPKVPCDVVCSLLWAFTFTMTLGWFAIPLTQLIGRSSKLDDPEAR